MSLEEIGRSASCPDFYHKSCQEGSLNARVESGIRELKSFADSLMPEREIVEVEKDSLYRCHSGGAIGHRALALLGAGRELMSARSRRTAESNPKRQGLLRLIKLIGGEEKCEDPVTV